MAAALMGLPPATAHQRGFGMIEVMVSLLVISVALFGTAKLQALAIGATHNSAQRSMIALQAASLAAAMRANDPYWAGTPATSVATLGTGNVTTLDPTLNAQTADCTSVTCTPLQMAGYDLQTWLRGLQAQLPGSGASIACAAATSVNPVTCTIEVDWSEKAISATSNTSGSSAATNQKYQLLVMP